MGNYMNKGNTRIGSAAAFKIEYLNKVGAVIIITLALRFVFV